MYIHLQFTNNGSDIKEYICNPAVILTERPMLFVWCVVSIILNLFVWLAFICIVRLYNINYAHKPSAILWKNGLNPNAAI